MRINHQGVKVLDMTGLSKAMVALAMALVAGASQAAPTYRFTVLDYGDQAAVVDINDLGGILWGGSDPTGQCGYWIGDASVPFQPFGFGVECDVVQIEEINNAYQARGTLKRDGVRVPAIWINGKPHDLTDPANSALVFVPDPGPRSTFFTTEGIRILDLPFELDPDRPASSGHVPTNARGDLVVPFQWNWGFNIGNGGLDTSYALLQLVPAPATFGLVLLPLAWCAGRRRQTVRVGGRRPAQRPHRR